MPRVSSKTLEQIRAIAVKKRNMTDLYSAVIDSIEPDLHSIDPGAFYASAAISLKRIADALEEIQSEMRGARLDRSE